MAASITIQVNDVSNLSGSDIANRVLPVNPNDSKGALNKLCDYLQGMNGGAYRGTVSINVADNPLYAATGTVTCAAASAFDTVTVNGVAFTAVTGSAPSGNQFWAASGVGFGDAHSAQSLATGINASVTPNVSGLVTASSNGSVVTITAVPAGIVGNNYSLTTSNGTRLAKVAFNGGLGGFGPYSPTGGLSYKYGA